MNPLIIWTTSFNIVFFVAQVIVVHVDVMHCLLTISIIDTTTCRILLVIIVIIVMRGWNYPKTSNAYAIRSWFYQEYFLLLLCLIILSFYRCLICLQVVKVTSSACPIHTLSNTLRAACARLVIINNTVLAASVRVVLTRLCCQRWKGVNCSLTIQIKCMSAKTICVVLCWRLSCWWMLVRWTMCVQLMWWVERIACCEVVIILIGLLLLLHPFQKARFAFRRGKITQHGILSILVGSTINFGILCYVYPLLFILNLITLHVAIIYIIY